MSTSNCITLHLTRKLETRIDSIDSELAQHKWYASDNKYGYHYAVRAISIGAGGQVVSNPPLKREACHSRFRPVRQNGDYTNAIPTDDISAVSGSYTALPWRCWAG